LNQRNMLNKRSKTRSLGEWMNIGDTGTYLKYITLFLITGSNASWKINEHPVKAESSDLILVTDGTYLGIAHRLNK
jgi:hypothetical protein